MFSLNQKVKASIEHVDRRRKDIIVMGKITGFSQMHAYGRQVCIEDGYGKHYWVMEDKVEAI